MHSPRRISLVLGGCLLALLCSCVPAWATPITVNLRVEGATSTLFEGPVSTEAHKIEAAEYNSKEPAALHPCDVNENGPEPLGSFGSPYGTPTTALYDAAQSLKLAFHASWYKPLNDFFVEGIGTLGPPESESWGYAVNYTTANVGGCQFQLAPGSEVLWASNYGLAKHVLELSGPATAEAGHPFTVHVRDGQTGVAIVGAAIGELTSGVTATIPGSAATDADGNVAVTLAAAGTVKLKATDTESVRSNGLAVCVHNGEDGTCGTSLAPIPVAVPRVLGVANGRVFAKRHGPRVLRGEVELQGGATLREVRVSLARSDGRRCSLLSGRRGEFVHTRCGAPAPFFAVGDTASFSYLLPYALPAGRYAFEIEAINSAGQAAKPVNGVSRVVFRVR